MIHGGDIYQNRVDYDFSVNTNPYGPSAAIREALSRGVQQAGHYPQYDNAQVIRSLSAYEELEPEQIICGNGASELFMAAVRAIAPKRAMVLAPGFYGYEWALQAEDCRIVTYHLQEAEGFALTDRILETLDASLDLLFLASPNNPTGQLIGEALLESILERCRQLQIPVILDECFRELVISGGEKRNQQEFLRRHPHLLLVKAFTKSYSIPGIRFGYAMSSDQKLLEKIRRVLPEWNVSLPAQLAAISCCSQRGFLQDCIARLAEDKAYLKAGLEARGFQVYPSDANFMLCHHKEKALKERLLQEGILIRDCRSFEGLEAGCYRIAVRTHQENERLLAALDRFSRSLSQAVQEEAADFEHRIEHVAPADIEKNSFAAIERELKERGICLDPQNRLTIMRAIHTTADFEYAHTMAFSDHAVARAKALIRQGADIVTDTTMALSGINKRELAKYGGQTHCYIADADVAAEAKERGVTRAVVSMEHAARLAKPVIFVVGNAPTALISLRRMMDAGNFRPAMIIGVPVGFVNVEISKELIMETNVPYIVNRGRKGGSNVAAAICNAILYELRDRIGE